MTHRVAEGRFFPIEDALRQPIPFKGVAQEVFALAVYVHLFCGVDRHHIFHKGKVAKGDARFQRVYGNAAVGAQHIVHVDLADALFRFFLEFLRRRGKIRVLVAEQLVGNLAGQEHAHIGTLMDRLAAEVHAHAGTDGGNVIRPKVADERLKCCKHLFARHDDFRVVGVQILRDFPRIFEVDRVRVHADGKGADGLFEQACGDGADEAAVQPAAQEEAERGVRVEPLFHARDEPFADAGADGLHIVLTIAGNGGDVAITYEFALRVVMPRREGEHMLREADEVFRLARNGDAAIRQVAVKQRADADGIARGDEVPGLPVIDHKRKFRIQLFEHGKAVFPVQRQQDLAVGFALERVFLLQLFAHRAEAVQLAVADHPILPEEEGLHALR